MGWEAVGAIVASVAVFSAALVKIAGNRRTRNETGVVALRNGRVPERCAKHDTRLNVIETEITHIKEGQARVETQLGKQAEALQAQGNEFNSLTRIIAEKL